MNRSIGPAGWLTRLAPLFDGLAVLLAGYAAYYLRFSRFQLPADYLLALLLGVLLALVLLPAARSYRGVRWHRPVRGVLSAVPGLVAVFGALMVLATLTKTTAEFSRIWMVAWTAGTVILMAAWRWLAGRQADRSAPRILLIGAGALAADAARRLQSTYGDRALTGFVRLDDQPTHGALPGPILGELGELETIIQSDEVAVTELWLAADRVPSEADDHLIQQLRLSSLPVRYVPDLRVLRLLGHRASEIAGMTVIELNATPLDGPDALVKAVLDRLIAGVLLVLLAPLLLLIVVAIKLDSRGPVLFGQPRHGGGGRVIRVLKFRSMRPGDANDARQVRRDDPRVTRVGRLLRRTSLDELPQLFNVLRGEMSLVGPRPHPLALNEAYSGRLAAYMQRHRVKPGITGLAQINGYRGETDTLEKMQKRLDYDLEYIESWSLGLDFRILLRTALTGWLDRNAY